MAAAWVVAIDGTAAATSKPEAATAVARLPLGMDVVTQGPLRAADS
jgi:hypothetical protein